MLQKLKQWYRSLNDAWRRSHPDLRVEIERLLDYNAKLKGELAREKAECERWTGRFLGSKASATVWEDKFNDLEVLVGPEQMDGIRNLTLQLEGERAEFEQRRKADEAAIEALRQQLAQQDAAHKQALEELQKTADSYAAALQVAQAYIDPNAQCPGCGAHNGEIKWVPEMKVEGADPGVIMHRCKQCDANWAEKPIVQSKAWKVELPPV